MGINNRLFSKALGANILAFLFVLVSTTAGAFKVETHVWIGQEIINDLSDDGALTIPRKDGEPFVFPIDPKLVQAITGNASVYRMGTIGPDAFPDIYTGQFVVHPGLPNDPNGWQTDDWLAYLLNAKNTKLISPQDMRKDNLFFKCQENDLPGNDCRNPSVIGEMTGEQLAFVYGYLNHASADVFAHTYVNQYSGDIFDILGDVAKGETLDDAFVEEHRHIELEKYIASYNPPMLDHLGNNLGKPQDLIKVPATFLRNTLVLNDTMADRNLNKAPHLAAVHNLRQFLVSNSLEQEFDKMDRTAATILVSYFTGYTLTDEQATKLVRLWRKVHKIVNATTGVEELQKVTNEFFRYTKSVVAKTAELETLYNDTFIQLNQVKGRLNQIGLELVDLGNKIANTPDQICHTVCRWAPWPLNKICDKLVCEANPAMVALQVAKKALEVERDLLLPEVDRILQQRQEAIDNAKLMVLASININEAMFNAVVDTLQVVSADINALRAHRDNWVKDIELAMDNYMVTSGEVIKAIMSGGDPLVPLSKWKDCWFLALAGGTFSQLNNGFCVAKDNFEIMTQSFDNILGVINRINPVTNALEDIKQAFVTKAEVYLKELATEFVLKMLDDAEAIKLIAQTFKQPASGPLLDSIFGTDLSTGKAKGLLEIPNMAARVNAEMGVVANQSGKMVFNKNAFAAMRNAITLAKLTLLSADQLNIVAGTVDPVYVATPGEPFNVLLGAIKTIDGNHQWMELAPPYPRRIGWNPDARKTGYEDEGWPQDRFYGYDVNSAKGGLKLWGDCIARENGFRQIFFGPLNPGLDTSEPDFVNVLSENYPYITDADHPFPSAGFNTNSCGTDLMMESLQVTSIVGDTLSVVGTFANRGDTPMTGKSFISLYLSADGILDASDINLPTGIHVFTGTDVPLNQLMEYSEPNVVIPGTVNAGDYRLLAVVDENNSVPEIDDDHDNLNRNNMAMSDITEVTVGVDLTMEYVTVPANIALGQDFPVSASVKNVGIGRSSGSATALFLLSKDKLYSVDDIQLGLSMYVGFLGTNESKAVNATLAMQSLGGQVILPGQYYILAITDFQTRGVKEIDDPDNRNGNNKAVSIPITVN